ncbi:unnamed protein product, partial [Mycena citricolor]
TPHAQNKTAGRQYYRQQYTPQATAQSDRPAPQTVTDDYERWYTENVPNNRMVLALRSQIPSEINWALDRILRLSRNEDFSLKKISGLRDALYEWPEWYVSDGLQTSNEMHSLFSVPPEV